MDVKPFGDPEDDEVEVAPAPPLPPAPAAPAPQAVPPAVEPTPTTSTIQAISRRNWTRALIWLAIGLIVLTGLGFAAVTIGDMIPG